MRAEMEGSGAISASSQRPMLHRGPAMIVDLEEQLADLQLTASSKQAAGVEELQLRHRHVHSAGYFAPSRHQPHVPG